MPLALNAMRAGQRSRSPKNQHPAASTVYINAADMKTGEHGINTGPSSILNARRQFVNARKRTNPCSARWLVLGLFDTEHKSTTLRVGKRYNLTEKTVAGVCGKISAVHPGICSATLLG